jgi:regulation of enolase protein 1 (concanavalin A-like superfamily)
VSAGHTTRFDQAGMMVRADERTWLKAGLEVTSGAVQVSTVFTRGFSDVSMALGPPISRDGLE